MAKEWSRGAMIASLPKHCLKCRQEGVKFEDRDLVREEKGGQTTIVGVSTALCTNRDCRAIYARRASVPGDGFKYGRAEVILVDTLPYHLPLGKVSLQLNDFPA